MATKYPNFALKKIICTQLFFNEFCDETKVIIHSWMDAAYVTIIHRTI
jgi:hypothetical protein